MSTTTRRAREYAAHLNNDNWRQYAACAGIDGEVFFPTGNQHQIAHQTEQAKRICHRCPSQAQCLEWALDTGQHSGVWGGLDEVERRQIARAPFSHIDVCMENQELIEARLAAGASLRDVGNQLGVGHWAVKRAVAVFRSQRATVEGESA